MKKNIGIPLFLNANDWIGGVNYFIALANALNSISSCDYQFIYLTNQPDVFKSANGDNVKIVHCPINKTLRFFNRIVNKFFRIDFVVSFYAKKNSVDLLSHTIPYQLIYTNNLFWQPDFQHKYYPEFFSEREISFRDLNVFLCRKSGHILLSSYQAESDFRKFYPELSSVKSHVLHFVPLISLNQSRSYPDILIEKYGFKLGERYFFSPNQFWIHKNHKVMLHALLKADPNIKIVCSGAISDYRSNQHIHELFDFVRDHDLQDRIFFLGLVEREVFYSLQQYALAIINPSYFEGWSTTVEEAKYMGIPLILSNIPVHKEQQEFHKGQQETDGLFYFFDPDDENELAHCMNMIFKRGMNHKVDEKSRNECYRLAQENFANSYISILTNCINRE